MREVSFDVLDNPALVELPREMNFLDLHERAIWLVRQLLALECCYGDRIARRSGFKILASHLNLRSHSVSDCRQAQNVADAESGRLARPKPTSTTLAALA